MNLEHWLKQASRELEEYESASLDAELLLCSVLECDRAKLYAWPDQPLSTDAVQALERLLSRRKLGEPVAYLLGQREFWSLEFDVNSDVLVPRPDTELIVELSLNALTSGVDGPVLDAGTGSGAIAVALTHEWQSQTTNRDKLPMYASDYSVPALQLAKHNAGKHHLHNIHFVRSNWLQAFADNSFAMIISNPPYLANNDSHLQEKTLQYEPIDALVSGADGLEDIRMLVSDAPRAGKHGCRLLIEHGASQAADVCTLMRAAGYSQVTTDQDMAGRDRVTSGICPEFD